MTRKRDYSKLKKVDKHKNTSYKIKQLKSNRATKEQLELLEKLGYNTPQGISKETAYLTIKALLKKNENIEIECIKNTNVQLMKCKEKVK